LCRQLVDWDRSGPPYGTILVSTLGHLHTLTPLRYLTCALSKERARLLTSNRVQSYTRLRSRRNLRPRLPTFHAGYTRTGLRQSERPGLLRGSECLVRFTREVLIPPLLRATGGHMQCTATPVLRAKTHHSAKGHPTGSSLLQKLRAGRAVEDPDKPHPICTEGIVWERP